MEPAFLGTGWIMGLGRGAILAAVVVISAYPASEFYDQPELIGILLILSARSLLHGLQSPGMPVLYQRLDYRSLFVLEVGQTLVGTLVSQVLAWQYRSVWAIVFGTLAGEMTVVVLSYVYSPRAARPRWESTAAREIYHLGHQVFLNTLVMALWMNLDRLLGLRWVTPREMGLYAVAWNLAAVAETLMLRVCEVYFTMLARLGDPDAQTAWHRALCRKMAAFAMPVAALGVIAGPAVIRLLYDVRYRDAGILFSILVARLMMRTLAQLHFQALLARAEVYLATRAYVVALIVQAVIFVPLVQQFGVVGMAGSCLISTVALTLTETLLMYRRGYVEMGSFALTLFWTLLALTVAGLVHGFTGPAEA